MNRSLQAEIQEWLRRYLAGEVSLEAFEEWFISHTWDVDQAGDPATIQLVYEVELDLAEHSNGHRSDEEMHGLLRALLEEPQQHPSATATTAVLADEIRNEPRQA